MAAELHLAEDALALHFLLQHLEGLVDIVVTDENLHAAFLFDRAVDGPMAKARTLGARLCTFGCRRHRRTNQRQYSKLCPPMATITANWRNGDFGTSPFYGQIFGTSQCSSVCATKWACWRQRTIGVSRFCVEVAVCRAGRSRLGWIGGGTPEVDNLSSYPLMGTFGSSISRVVGTRRHKTEPISSRNCGSFAPRPYCHC